MWLQGQPRVSKAGRGTWRGLKVVTLDHEVPRSPNPLNWEAEGKWSLGPNKEPWRGTSGARPWPRHWPPPTQNSRAEGHLFHPQVLPQHMHTYSLSSPETEITPSHPPKDVSGRHPGCASVLGEPRPRGLQPQSHSAAPGLSSRATLSSLGAESPRLRWPCSNPPSQHTHLLRWPGSGQVQL